MTHLGRRHLSRLPPITCECRDDTSRPRGSTPMIRLPASAGMTPLASATLYPKLPRVNNTFATMIFGGFRWADFVFTDGHQALPRHGLAWRSQGRDTSQSLCDTEVTSPVVAWPFPATGILEYAVSSRDIDSCQEPVKRRPRSPREIAHLGPCATSE